MTETQYKRHNSPPGSFWADDTRVEELVRLWHAGLSTSRIAAKIGAPSRNSVISKKNRLGLPNRSEGNRPKYTKPRGWTTTGGVGKNEPHQWHKPKQSPPKLPPKPVSPVQALKADGLPLPPPSEADRPRVSFNALDPRKHCRWPCLPDVSGVGQDAPMFCGATPAKGLVYCRVHAIRAYGAPELRRQSLMPATHAPSMMGRILDEVA